MDDADAVLDPQAVVAHEEEMRRRSRFGFGRNWEAFAGRIDESAIEHAERSLVTLLAPTGLVREGRLDGLDLLDAGCGSGLSSLAALRLGATVTAFDFDPQSVTTTRTLIDEQASPEQIERFTLLHGSVLDGGFLLGLPRPDIVYSWGVLHHTGAMWDACERLARIVPTGGGLVVALYHDAGLASNVWWAVKRLSVLLPRPFQLALAGVALVPIELFAFARALLRRDPIGYLRRWADYRSLRGMSRWHDHLDWVGGFPYEWARPADVVGFFERAGLRHLQTIDATAWGCNEFTFLREA